MSPHTQFKAISQTRISDEVLHQLKSAILAGDFKPGHKLPSERELMESFTVSRSAVREAVRALELTGFVSVRQGPTGGAFVNDLSFDHLADSYFDLFKAGKLSVAELVQVRNHIGPEIARLAALNLTPENGRELQKILLEETLPTNNHKEWIRRNVQMDLHLGRMCGNRLYLAILEPLLNLFLEVIMVVKPEKMVIHNREEHAVIVERVLAKDPGGAADAMRRHLAVTGESLMSLEKAYRKRTGLAG